MTADIGTAGAGHGGVIHDIGYRRYEGPRLGRPGIIRALIWHSFRSAFGIGRGVKAKIVPIIAFVIMCLPAVANTVGVAQGNPRTVPYDTYIFQLRVIIMLIFIAAQAPELVSRDLRSHVLPLYFSRPLHRLDYPFAKLAAFILACLAMIEIPLLFLYLGTISQSHGGSAIWHETKALIPGLLVGLMWAVLLAAIGLFLASLSGRRAYSTGTIAIFFFLTWILAGILDKVSTGGQGHPFRGAGGQAATTGAQLSGLASPFTVLDGVRQWLGGTSPGPIPPPGSYGPLYAAVLVVLLGLAVGGLAIRYRKAGVA
ncbi:MAG: type transport system permease protein [Streptosporangiaceae bacterium]|nr:type transport system permease protein [Streptosporangiaceae bacterium]